MSEHRQRIDPVTAEYLVRTARADQPGCGPLATLLAAAASPARRGELAGEDAAVLAFRAANLVRPPASRRRSMLSSALARLASAKIAVAVVAAGSGIALAAGSGHLPGLGGPNHHPTARPDTNGTTGQHPTSAPGSTAPTPSAGSPWARSTSRTASPRPTPSAPADGSPAPNLRGLCTAYAAHAGENPGKVLDNPAFTVLIDAAGGQAEVASYCTTLLGTDHAQPSTHPTGGKSGHGTPPHPTRGPASHTGPHPPRHPA
jgi:hypothetical protein